MANASGPATEGFLPGGFDHAASGVTYRMEEEAGRVYLTFERKPVDRGLGIAVVGDGALGGAFSGGELKGRRELKYFLGSGKRGRTYLFEQDGYWFESPINWYAKKKVWDMAPGYLNVREVPLTLQVDSGCLRCHASGAQPPLPEARNRYAGEPFLHGGITCMACHGDASAHVASGGRTAMIKLQELPAVRRDSVCLSCHLEGQEAVVHEGKRLVDFRPGENLFDYASYFVREAGGSGVARQDVRATSQWEALLQSGCKRGAGEKLTCSTCHDPHGSTNTMSSSERVAFYRGRCLQCHDANAAVLMGFGGMGEKGFAATHHPENPDCAGCHMPRASANDIAHEQVTDHRIPRKPGAKWASGGTGELVAIGMAVEVPGQGGSRNLGLAYAMVAMETSKTSEASRGDMHAGKRALQLLREAEGLPEAVRDGELHERLGFLEQLAGDKDEAAREYELALTADAHDSIAAGNLALLKAGDKRYEAAIGLWQRAFQEDPAQVKAGTNLAIVECALGEKESAVATLDRVLEFSPDDGSARELVGEIRSGRHRCRMH
jgi:hypothetical protein